MEQKNLEMIEDFDKWKSTLHKLVHVSEIVGMKEDTVTDLAKKMGDYLANHVDPENREQRLLKQLWEVGTQEERHILAHLMFKMVETEYHGNH